MGRTMFDSYGHRFAAMESVQNFQRLRYYWPNGSEKYVCVNFDLNASETDLSWKITKYSQDKSKEWGYIDGAVAVESSIDTLFLGYS